MHRLKLFFTYYGGKWRVAKHYPEPLYRTVVEPFAGSAGYSLHYPMLNVVLYDLDPLICSLWNYLIHVSQNEIRHLPLTFQHTDELRCCQEAKWLIGFWLNKGNTRPCHTPSKWMRRSIAGLSCPPSSYWGEEIRERIASQLPWIRHWRVFNQSYTEIDNQQATWFVDPPYQWAGGYKYREIDYEHLSAWCRRRYGQVIVCEQEGADWMQFDAFRTIKTTEGARGMHQSKEVVWIKTLRFPRQLRFSRVERFPRC